MCIMMMTLIIIIHNHLFALIPAFLCLGVVDPLITNNTTITGIMHGPTIVFEIWLSMCLGQPKKLLDNQNTDTLYTCPMNNRPMDNHKSETKTYLCTQVLILDRQPETVIWLSMGQPFIFVNSNTGPQVIETHGTSTLPDIFFPVFWVLIMEVFQGLHSS